MHINIIQVHIWNNKKYISWLSSSSSFIRCSRQNFPKNNNIRSEDIGTTSEQLSIPIDDYAKESLYNKATYFIVDFFIHIYQN